MSRHSSTVIWVRRAQAFHSKTYRRDHTCVGQAFLRPRFDFSGDRQTTAEECEAMDDEAHRHCLVANAVQTAISIEPARISQ